MFERKFCEPTRASQSLTSEPISRIHLPRI
jgi:hypothetical protein